jgi:hypothetical protein
MSHARNFLLVATLCFICGVSSLTIDWQILKANAAQALCCNTYAITNELFFCLANAPAQNQLNFFTFDPTGAMQPFTPAQGIGHLEMKPAAVKLAPNSPFPFPGWNLGDIYVPTAGGTITKIVGAQQVISPWVTIAGETHMTCELQFDETGTVLNGDLVVTNLNAVYRVKPDGTYTQIVKSNQLGNYEGIVVVPNNQTRYGGLAGFIYLPQTGDTSIVATQVGPSPPASAGRKIAQISPTGTINFLQVPCHVDTMYIVKQFDNFYAMDAGQIYFASWDSLQNGFEGEIMVQCEFVESGSPTGFYRLFWDFTANNYAYEAIQLAAGAPQPPSNSQWEHFCTSRGGAANQLPGGFSFCMWDSIDGRTLHFGSFQLTNGDTIAQNWDYTGAANVQYPSGAQPPATANTMTIAIVQDTNNQFYLQIVIGTPPGNSPPQTTLQLTYSSPSFTDTNFLLRIQDTSSDSYLWDGSSGSFAWSWTGTPGENRGLVLGPMAHIPAMAPFSLNFNISGIGNVALVSDQNSKTFTVNNGNIAFSLNRISCTCGNGIIDDSTLEQCDNGALNSLPTQCCDLSCNLKPASTICNPANASDPCSFPTLCQSQGLSASCPVVPPNPNCGNCTAPFTGPKCNIVNCFALKTCQSCYNASFSAQCDWCCETQTCNPSGTCQTKIPTTCPVCVNSSCIHGSCSCGACVCQPGFAGPNCDQTVDCTGNVTNNPKKIDQCGVCGGNGLSCIGCDGQLYGAKYDNCGICGGNGSVCFNPCKDTPDCGSCMENNQCGWCKQTSKCVKKSAPGGCPTPFATDCLALAPSIIIGATIGGGIIAAIVIGAVAAIVAGIIGGKKGYDAYMKNKNNIHGAQENPMYNDSGRSGRNPMYEGGK